ncbi:hypothetical protein BD779DRAFT_1680115 [Infundibulicybe gibba]|nr:hypothetical protein BD779DRAFT_1680115 [Infundibulicybe gibba]
MPNQSETQDTPVNFESLHTPAGVPQSHDRSIARDATRGSATSGIREPGDRHDAGRTQSPAPQSYELPSAYTVARIEDAVEEYRKGEISKTRALAIITSHLDTDGDDDDPVKYQAFLGYLRTLNLLESRAVDHDQNGATAALGFQNRINPRRGTSIQPPAEGDRPMSVRQPDHSGIDVIRVGRKRTRSRQSSIDSDSPGEPFTDSKGRIVETNKRVVVAKSSMPFYRDGDEPIDGIAYPPSCQETERIYKLVNLDPIATRKWILADPRAPIFPISEWDNIIRGYPVCLDTVFSARYSIGPPKENLGRVGDLEFSIGRPEILKKVQTSGDWISTWFDVVQATSFVFPHRQSELMEYGQRISASFAAKHVSSHGQIIAYDAKLRRRIGSGRTRLLPGRDDVEELRSAILDYDGVENPIGRSGPSTRKLSGGESTSSSEICRRFNSTTGCPNSNAACKYRHACLSCKQFGHGKGKCEKKGNTLDRGSS